jgi:hypothetical protein
MTFVRKVDCAFCGENKPEAWGGYCHECLVFIVGFAQGMRVFIGGLFAYKKNDVALEEPDNA